MEKRHAVFRFVAFLASSILVSATNVQADCPSCRRAASGPVKVHGAEPLLGVDSASYSEMEHGGSTAACSGPFCGYQCRSEGVFFTVELPVLDVLQTSGTDLASRLLMLQTGEANTLGELDPGFDASVRVSAGWNTCDGLGWRVRYWEFDNLAAQVLPTIMPDSPDFAVHGWNTNVFDLEVTVNTAKFRGWDSTLSAGYRFVNYEEDVRLLRNVSTLSSVNTRYIGNGLTGSIEGRRPLVASWNFLANGRLSLLLGGEQVAISGADPVPSVTRSAFDARFIFESQLGVERIWPLCNGGYYFVRGGGEIQYWNEFVAPIRSTENNDVSFGGFFVAFGLQR